MKSKPVNEIFEDRWSHEQHGSITVFEKEEAWSGFYNSKGQKLFSNRTIGFVVPKGKSK